ncbi:hypothetical protein [Kitasatospora sp. GAS204B]|uniref:hypothetical protein n=1 Tax=unclassified Kitasatospora TaxID=2633591 RepID=UPI002474B9B2|nr:hypothetical protein [Kitasatospora sp. GAS204B]MDH6119328.1 hypothetical protein [Kitasatospora sp. GAS204B]
MSSSGQISAPIDALKRLEIDALYSAQAYFEAAKSADFWGRFIVFFPAIISAASGIATAIFSIKFGGALSATSGAVAATASFIGSGKLAASYRESARQYTALRHNARLEASIGLSRAAEELEQVVRSLNKVRESIVAKDEPVPNRLFRRASRRIGAGITSYEQAVAETPPVQ